MKKRYWSSYEQAKLLRLRDAQKLAWPAIVEAMPGRTEGACKVQYYAILRDQAQARRYRPTRLAVSRPRPAPVIVTAPPVAPATTIAPAPRGASLSALREAAELRLRIAERGLTGGWFNDPPPGRSALDARRRAAAEATQGRSAGEVSDAG
ncbi:SANT/Myb-like DNA-binding domain-containing protein [Bradyrhizobium sp. BR 10261]|uniref:SANT/Myb-like DNA-binding domain-containing protein n=1 Tax=Bradyrhizobium sp. BR 10261 TaxID=2749992 RepID=UPI001C64CDBE|nr:SANT/Myb-like DNA-binding domain-containing protein [Bradyrhizobium sp. BR 10261]MBW7966785.1 hypothetical protein [Bradyrhizobium sp. BR 10261]